MNHKVLSKSIASINQSLKYITSVKCDLAAIRETEERMRYIGLHTSSISYKKRRIDVLSTQEFATVICYVLSFNDHERVLEQLWKILEEYSSSSDDLQLVKAYSSILRMDAVSKLQQLEETPAE